MTRGEAVQAVKDGVTYGEIKAILIEARNRIVRWNKNSRSSYTKSYGLMFNSQWKFFKRIHSEDDLAKKVKGATVNRVVEILRDFKEGDVIIQRDDRIYRKPTHQEPIQL